MNLKTVKLHNSTKTKLIFSVLLLCSLIFTSCENFMKGNDFKSLLEATIEYSNAPFARITITSEGTATASLVPAAGSYTDKYKAGDSFELKFEPQPTYNFIKWIATPGDAVVFEKENEVNTKVTIKSVEDPIIIQPYALPKDKLTIHFSTDHGATVPAEEKQLYLHAEFSLSYREEAGYAFTGWKIIDDLTGKEVNDVLQLSGTGTDVTATVLAINRKVTVRAETEVRPSVVSVTPLYDSNGVFRDRRIVVMFDSEIDESSIYYDNAEQTKLLAEGKTLLIIEDEKNPNYGKCYGYKDGTDDSSIRFKNILITKRRNQSEVLLAHYEPPYLDKSDPSVLRIDTKQGNDAPPETTDILVTLLQPIGTKVNDEIISLSNNYKWSYYTNGKIDNEAPKFSDSFKVTLNDNNKTYKFSEEDVFKSKNPTEDQTVYKANNIKKQNLWVEGSFVDGGSGPKSLKWELYKVNSPYYPMTKDELIKHGQIDDLVISGADAEIKSRNVDNSFTSGTVVTLGLTDNDEGLYRIDFICSDKNERQGTSSYYFVNDTKAPSAVTKLKGSRTSADKETVSWETTKDAIVTVECKSLGKKKVINLGTSVTFENLVNLTKYKYEFSVEDVCGNKNAASDATYQDNTPPSKLTIRYSEGRNGRVNVFFTTPNDEDYCKTTVSYGSADATQQDVSSASGRNKSSFRTFNNGTNWTLYNYYFRTYDYAGNYSEYVYLQEMAGAVPGMICYAPGNNPDNISCSKNYWPNRNPIGIVADGSDQARVKILALDKSNAYTYGEGHSDFCADNAWSQYRWKISVAKGATAYYNNADGLTWYETVRDMANYKANANGSYDQYGKWRDSIWTYAMNKNKNSPVTWWIPARHEWQYVAWNWKPMCDARDVLNSNHVPFANIYSDEAYYVATPNYYTSSCNFVGINYNDNGNMNEYLANGEWMQMYTTSYQRDKYARSGYYGAYVRCMAFIDMR